jgi:hypothetical protein
LFVGEDQHGHFLEFFLLEHQLELLPRDLNSFLVSRIDHEDYRISVLVVTPPVGTQAGLPAQVPHLELKVFIGHRLHVETHSYRQVYQLASKLEEEDEFLKKRDLLGTVGTISSKCRRSIQYRKGEVRLGDFCCKHELLTEDRGLAGIVETNDDDTHLLLSQETLE